MEALHEFGVSTRRGHALVVTLGVVACILLVAGGVTMFMGAPPQIEPWMWPMIGAGVAALAGAFALHRTRRRTLRIVHGPDGHHLLIDREDIRLAFPLKVSGDQFTNHVNGIPMYEVWLALADSRTGIALTETRGAIHGAQANWLSNMEGGVARTRFDVGGTGMLAKLRAVVEQLNETVRSSRSR
jgi:hypothetical protein